MLAPEKVPLGLRIGAMEKMNNLGTTKYMPSSDCIRLIYRAVALIAAVGSLFVGMGNRECYAQSPGGSVMSPGISVISLPKARIVIVERACGPRYCGFNKPGTERPETEVTSIVAEIGGQRHQKKYSLPCKGMFDAWGGGRNENFHSKNRRFGASCYDDNYCVLRGVFGDGAETFAVQWEISNGKVSWTVFTGIADIVDLFLSDIDPPGNVYD